MFVGTVSVILLTELFFIFYFTRAYQRLARIPKLHGPEVHDGTAAFSRVLQFIQLFKGRPQLQAKLRAYIRLWFLGAPWHEIQQGNLEEHLAYSFFYKSRDAMHASGQGTVLQDMVLQLRDRCGLDIPEGYNPQLRGMWHLNEPLRAHYRPLMFYLALECIAGLSSTAMACLGFKKGRARGIGYFVQGVQTKPVGAITNGASVLQHEHASRQPSSYKGDADKGSFREQLLSKCEQAEAGVAACVSGNTHEHGATHEGEQATIPGTGETVPLIFLHGVGVGLLTYLPVLAQLVQDTTAAKQAMLVMEFKHVGLRLCSKVPTADEAADAVVEAMDQLGWKKACVVGHSYGTFVASRMIQMHGDRVHSVALIDPVCFGMFMPHLLHNFIYAPPRKDCLWHRIKDGFVRFAAREVHCAATFCRRFYWTAVQLDPCMLPANSLVILGGKDELLHGEEVATALAAAPQAGDTDQTITNMAQRRSSVGTALNATNTSAVSFAGDASSSRSGDHVVSTDSSSNDGRANHGCKGLHSSGAHRTAMGEGSFNMSACSSSGMYMPAEEGYTTMLVEGITRCAKLHNDEHHEICSNKDAASVMGNSCGQMQHNNSQYQEMGNGYGYGRGSGCATHGVHDNAAKDAEEANNVSSNTFRADGRCNSVPDIANMHPDTKQDAGNQQQQQEGTTVANTKGSFKLVYIPEMEHADFMFKPHFMRKVVPEVLAFIADMRKLPSA